MRDSRLTGSIAEDIFLSLLNEQAIFATSFDTVALDGIVYDTVGHYFRTGNSPFYVQIKCRGSNGDRFNPQGHSSRTFEQMREVARELNIPETSLYFVAGFFKNGNIRTVVYYCVPLDQLDWFKSKRGGQYRFSIERCEQVVVEAESAFKIYRHARVSQAAPTSSCAFQVQRTPELRFSATVGQEPEIESSLV